MDSNICGKVRCGGSLVFRGKGFCETKHDAGMGKIYTLPWVHFWVGGGEGVGVSRLRVKRTQGNMYSGKSRPVVKSSLLYPLKQTG